MIKNIIKNTIPILIALMLENTMYSEDIVGGEKLFQLSFDELMNLSVNTGNITGLTVSQSPVSVTTITANEIELTPVRNLYDLLEIYVPGAIFFNHYDSPHLGVRGLIVDRNYKFLLLVNGRDMNLKAHNGATSELEMWNLGDIDRIDIIRGPGSVTYGPGAVAGIINIITKNSMSEPGIKISTGYCSAYNSLGLSGEIYQKIGNDKLYFFGSVQKTNGFQNPTIYAPLSDNQFGIIGRQGDTTQKPIDYFRDYNDLPQLKFHIQYTFLDNFDLTLRYTRQGASINPNFPKVSQQTGFDSLGFIKLGDPIDLIQTQDQHITLTLNNESSIENWFDISTMLSLSSEDYIRRTEWLKQFPKDIAPAWDTLMMLQDPNNIWNHLYDFSESSILGRIIFNKDLSESFKLAIGTELSYNFWGPGWTNDSKEFVMGDNSDIISGKDSYLYDTKIPYIGVPAGSGYFVGNGWSTFTFSFLWEGLWKIGNKLTLLVSARRDKDTYSKWLFSPRAALIYEFSENNLLKFVVQQSKRNNTASRLLIMNRTQTEPLPESLTGFELIYSGIIKDNFLINTSFFYNNLDVISWYDINRSSKLTGNLCLLGFELEAKYQNNGVEIILNQSFVKQLKWELADSILFSGISYSDYTLSTDNATFNASGNDLNNWSNFATKFIINYSLFENKLILHLDSRIFWNFEGEKAGLQSLKDANAMDEQTGKIISDIINTTDSLKMYGTDIKINFSIGYKVNKVAKISLMCMNLFNLTENKRYFYDSGIRKTQNFLRHGFIVEPFSINFKLDLYF